MIDTRTARTKAFPWFIALAIVGAFLLHRPELIVLATPFVVGFARAARPRARPDVAITSDLSTDRTIEGSAIELHVVVGSPEGRATIEVRPLIQGPITIVEGPPAVRAIVTPRSPLRHTWRLECGRCGVYGIGALELRDAEPLAGREHVWRVHSEQRLKVLPGRQRMRALIAPRRTHGAGGSALAQHHGRGIEFTQVRPYTPGDRPRDVNWRVSSRRGELWVSARRPEESSDIILFLDSFVDITSSEPSSLTAAVSVAASLARAHLARHDRVGIVGFGGVLSWIEPAAGIAHEYRLLDVLLGTQPFTNYAPKRVDAIPTRALPPRALVVMISPLLDERARAALDQLARFDTVLVEVSAERYARPTADAAGDLARRLWNLERAARRRRARELGIPVIEWDPRQPIEPVVAQLERWHQRIPARSM